MSTITVAVDNLEWDSLYEHPERKDSLHKIRQGMAIEIQFMLWPDLILQHWNGKTPAKTLAYLDIDQQNSPSERKIISLKTKSNLCLFSGFARKIHRQTWKTNQSKRTIASLLDCGFPIILEENVNQESHSAYFDKEGDYIMGISLLFASVAFSGSPFRAPVVCKVVNVTPLKVVPSATLLELEPLPPLVVPETRISYHAEDVEDVELDSYVSNRVRLTRYK